MPWRAVLDALETGKMKGIGDGLTGAQRDTIAKFSGSAEGVATIPASARCAAGSGLASSATSAKLPSWNGWADAANTRFQSAENLARVDDIVQELDNPAMHQAAMRM